MVEVVCEWCGKKFNRYPSDIKRSKHIFCSHKCSNKWKKESDYNTGENNPFYNKTHSDKHRNKLKRIYTGKRKKQYIKKSCKWCGNNFEVKPSRKDTALFCSQDCMLLWRSEEFSGEGHPRYKGGRERYYGPHWIRKRNKVLKRDNHTCQICGKEIDENMRGPDVHHKRPLKDFKDAKGSIDFESANKLYNLISLCPSCHQKIERYSLLLFNPLHEK